MSASPQGGCPDVVGWVLEDAEAALAADGRHCVRRLTVWRGGVPGGGAPPRPAVYRVLAVRPGDDGRVVELVLAAFSGGGPAPDPDAGGGEGG